MPIESPEKRFRNKNVVVVFQASGDCFELRNETSVEAEFEALIFNRFKFLQSETEPFLQNP